MSAAALFCYCFEIPLEAARSDPEGIIERLGRRIVEEGCWCDGVNPSGRCCLAETARLGLEPGRATAAPSSIADRGG